MAVRPFVMFPDARLKAVAAPVGEITDEIRQLWDDMLDTMYAMPGVGLAAPQIGVGLRVAVLDCSETGREPVRLANPDIIRASVEFRGHEEASPNLPGVWALVQRAAEVTVRFIGPDGPEERVFEGLWATSVQHQIDHLNGKLFIDRIGPVKRRMLIDRARKLRRRG